MPRYLDRDDWPEHPILSRLVGRSDFDTDGTFQLKGYDPEEFDYCVTVYIEGSNDGGQTWQGCEFSGRISYVDETGAGWRWPFSSEGVYFRSEQLIWRAVLPE